MTPGVGSSPTGAKIFVSLLVPLGKALYSNCSVVWRSRKAVGPVYMYLNINTSVHVKERHRLFKSRGSSRYSGLQKMFSLSGTFISNGQNFLSNMCAKRTSRAHSAKSLRPGSRARLRALEAKGILMLSGAFWAYI